MTDGTVDSGIEFDLSSLLSVSDVTEVELLEPQKAGATTIVQTEPSPQYHELKSRVVEGSPRADFRNSNMALRCQVRRNLERQQFMEQQEEEKRKAQQRQQQLQQSKTIAISSVYHSPEVPPKVLDVKTELSFPTVYHMRSKQQEAVKTFITESDDRQMPAHSMPNLALPGSVDGANFFTNSAPTELETGSSFSTDLDMDLDILSAVLEPASESDLGSINPTFMHMASLPPQQTLFGAGGHLEGLTLEVDSAGAKSSSSCPPVFPSQGQVSPPDNMSEQEQMIWAKDRQKKDNHNMIERRRRYNINDRIKELGTLLPKSYDQEMRQHKGTILKASVDYIKKLKSQVDILQELKEAKQQTDKMNQKLALKVNQMWTVMRQHGLVPTGQEEETINPDMMVPPSSVMSLPNNTHTLTNTTPTSTHTTLNNNTTTHQLLLAEDNSAVAVSAFSGFGGVIHPGFVTSPLTGSHHGDFMEDTGSPVTSDPMLTSAPVSPDHDDNTL